MAKSLRQKVEAACAAFKLKVKNFFVRAFQAKYGFRRGIMREARNAAGAFSSNRSLNSRAKAAISHFLSGLHGDVTAAA